MRPTLRQKFVVGNWKIYANAAEARRLAKAVVDGMGAEERVSVTLCPPFPYLAPVREILKGSGVALGALHPDQFLAIVRAAISASQTHENTADTAA